MKFLALSEKNILDIKKIKEIKNYKKKAKKIIKCLKIKFLFFFIFSFIFLILFWYYLSCFCVVYRNTQVYLLEDTLISFGLSLLYPFGFYLLPGLFRIPSLKKSKEKKECLYSFSQIIQLF